jgi:hypothetical protein
MPVKSLRESGIYSDSSSTLISRLALHPHFILFTLLVSKKHGLTSICRVGRISIVYPDSSWARLKV